MIIMTGLANRGADAIELISFLPKNIQKTENNVLAIAIGMLPLSVKYPYP